MIFCKSKKFFLFFAVLVLCASCQDDEQINNQILEIKQLDSLIANKLVYRQNRDHFILDLKTKV